MQWKKKILHLPSACGCTVGRGSAYDMQVALIQQLSQVEVVVRQAAVCGLVSAIACFRSMRLERA